MSIAARDTRDMTYRSSDTGIGLVLAVDPELLERGVAKGRRGQR